MRHVMVDIETMGTRPGCVILSIGAVMAEIDGEKYETLGKFYRTIDIESWPDSFKIEKSTIKWWAGIGGETMREAFSGEEDCRIVLKSFVEWSSDALIWGKGATFDNVILKEACRLLGIEGWQFRNDMCFRTLAKMNPHIKPSFPKMAHRAIDDAESQMEHLAAILAGNSKTKLMSAIDQHVMRHSNNGRVEPVGMDMAWNDSGKVYDISGLEPIPGATVLKTSGVA